MPCIYQRDLKSGLGFLPKCGIYGFISFPFSANVPSGFLGCFLLNSGLLSSELFTPPVLVLQVPPPMPHRKFLKIPVQRASDLQFPFYY